MKFAKLAGALGALALSLGMASTASAITYTLNLTEAQSGLPAPYGQVDVTQGTNALNFSVTLFDGLRFVDTGAHYAFAFSLDGAPAITLTAPAGFSLVSDPPNIPNSPFSGFDYGIVCVAPACGPGGSLSYPSPLNFTINGTGLTLAMIGTANPYNGQVVRFSADTLAVSGATGTIGGGNVVPEPATWAMMIIGFGMVGIGLRRRRRLEPTFA